MLVKFGVFIQRKVAHCNYFVYFSINSCPSERHDLTCSGHGTCLSAVGECQCDEDFKGPACNIPACPKNCEPEGVRRGICNKEKKRCDCQPGFTGKSNSNFPSFKKIKG